MGPKEWTQDEIDEMCGHFDDDDDCSDDGWDMGEECGRWRNGVLSGHCLKAGSEECDWECPLRDEPSAGRLAKKIEAVVPARDINRPGLTKEPVMIMPKKNTP